MAATDTIEEIRLAWERELPGVPNRSIGILTRVWRAAKLLSDERRRTLSRLGIDRATLDLLSVLRRAGAPFTLAPREIARRSLISAGAVSQRVVRAEAAGLVEVTRTPSGRRVATVRLSVSGHDWVDRSVADLLTHEETLVEHLSATDREELARLLGLLLEGLHERLGVPDSPQADRGGGSDVDGPGTVT